MYKSRHSELYPQRRGGFSLFAHNEPQGVSGLGDTVDTTNFANWLAQQPLDMQTLQLAYQAANPPSVGAPSTGSGFSFSNIPTWALIAGGAFIVILVSDFGPIGKRYS